MNGLTLEHLAALRQALGEINEQIRILAENNQRLAAAMAEHNARTDSRLNDLEMAALLDNSSAGVLDPTDVDELFDRFNFASPTDSTPNTIFSDLMRSDEFLAPSSTLAESTHTEANTDVSSVTEASLSTYDSDDSQYQNPAFIFEMYRAAAAGNRSQLKRSRDSAHSM